MMTIYQQARDQIAAQEQRRDTAQRFRETAQTDQERRYADFAIQDCAARITQILQAFARQIEEAG